MPSPAETRRLPVLVEEAIEYACESAMLERCGVEQEAQEAMRLYLKTWVAGPLKQVLSWSRGEIVSAQISRWRR